MKKTTYLLALFISASLFTLSCSEKAENKTGDTTGVSDTEIAIGTWGPLTGPAALWGNIIKGMDSYFKLINEEGGVNGRNINFIYKDDAYDPSRTVPAVRELIQQDEVFAIAGGVGTATNMAVSQFLSENKVPWITPMSGVSYWTFPPKENIYSSFPLYFDEGQIMAKMAVEDLDIKKVGIIYQNDDFGRSGLVGVKDILDRHGLDFVAALPVEVTDSDLSSHVARLKESGAEAVFLWTLPRQAAVVLGNSAVIDYNPRWFASLALSDMALMHDITKGAWEGVYFTYVAAVMYNDVANPTIEKFRKAFAKHYPDDRWGTFAMAGFIWAEPLIEGLRRTGSNLTRENFLEAMSSMNNFIGSSEIPLSFSPTSHLGSRSLVIMQCKSGDEAVRIGDFIEAESDIEKLTADLHGE